jgi:hypothetical protein
MSQPKDPPISFRPGAARLECIEAWAKERKLSRHLAILTLLDAGLRAQGPSLPALEVQTAIRAEAARRQGKPQPEPFKSRLKGEWKPR